MNMIIYSIVYKSFKEDVQNKGYSIITINIILAYTGRTDETGNGSISMEPDMLRPMMQQIIREEVRKVLEGQDVSKINREMPTEVDLMEEEPLRMDQTMRQNVVDAISAFRRA